MAEANTQSMTATLRGFSNLPPLRQVALVVGLALSVSLGVAVVLWSQSPTYSLLYGNLPESEVVQVVGALDKSGIPYRLEGGNMVMVPASKVHQARLSLASQGMPQSTPSGYGLLDQDTGMGISRFMENTRYQRALEGELVRTITSLRNVEGARVHLALPKQSVFLRDRRKPAASVLLNLYPGRDLDEAQVAGIVNLVASSVPELEPEQVTVVDQRGRLLTGSPGSRDLTLSTTQFKYARDLEEHYVQRIHDILAPIVGPDGVRAQVVADLDFTQVEETSESYDPQGAVTRSENLEEQTTRDGGPMGVPGALTNQPPPAGTTAPGTQEAGSAPPVQSSSRTIRNYELGRTLSHTRRAPVTLRRLSVAAAVDYRVQRNDKGEEERVPLSTEEMDHINTLVKEAVGFDEARSDSVSVINVSFREAAAAEPLPATPVWQEPWVWDVGKQVLGGLLVLFLVLFVLRPVLRSLAQKERPQAQGQLPAGQAPEALPGGQQHAALGHEQRAAIAPPPPPEEQHLELAKSLAQQDPKRVAQVVKTWVAADG